MIKRIRYTTNELQMMSVALWQLEEALDISKEHWEDNAELKRKNEKDLKTIKSARQKVNEALERAIKEE